MQEWKKQLGHTVTSVETVTGRFGVRNGCRRGGGGRRRIRLGRPARRRVGHGRVPLARRGRGRREHRPVRPERGADRRRRRRGIRLDDRLLGGGRRRGIRLGHRPVARRRRRGVRHRARRRRIRAADEYAAQQVGRTTVADALTEYADVHALKPTRRRIPNPFSIKVALGDRIDRFRSSSSP